MQYKDIERIQPNCFAKSQQYSAISKYFFNQWLVGRDFFVTRTICKTFTNKIMHDKQNAVVNLKLQLTYIFMFYHDQT